MTNKKDIRNFAPNNLITWLVALVLPALVMIVLEVPLHIRAITRVLALLDPYSYFILLAAVCLAPSAFLLFIRRGHLNLRSWHVALCCVVSLVYAPLLWIESLYAACVLFNDCFNI